MWRMNCNRLVLGDIIILRKKSSRAKKHCTDSDLEFDLTAGTHQNKSRRVKYQRTDSDLKVDRQI